MPDLHRDEEPPIIKIASPVETLVRQDEPMEDEEKILAGRDDANIPAMLTKDVPGG